MIDRTNNFPGLITFKKHIFALAFAGRYWKNLLVFHIFFSVQKTAFTKSCQYDFLRWKLLMFRRKNLTLCIFFCSRFSLFFFCNLLTTITWIIYKMHIFTTKTKIVSILFFFLFSTTFEMFAIHKRRRYDYCNLWYLNCRESLNRTNEKF